MADGTCCIYRVVFDREVESLDGAQGTVRKVSHANSGVIFDR